MLSTLNHQQNSTFVSTHVHPNITDSHVTKPHILYGEVLDNSIQAIFTHYVSMLVACFNPSSSSSFKTEYKPLIKMIHQKKGGIEKLIFFDNGIGMSKKEFIQTRDLGASKVLFELSKINYLGKVGKYGVGKNAITVLAKDHTFETLKEGESHVVIGKFAIEEADEKKSIGYHITSREKNYDEDHFTIITLQGLKRPIEEIDYNGKETNRYESILAAKYTLFLKKYEFPSKIKHFIFPKELELPLITFKIERDFDDPGKSRETELNYVKSNPVMQSVEFINALKEDEKFIYDLSDEKGVFGMFYAGYLKNQLIEDKFTRRKYPCEKKVTVFVNGIFLADVDLVSIIKIHPNLKMQYQNLKGFVFIQSKPEDVRFDMNVHKQGFNDDGWLQEYKQSGNFKLMNDELKKFIEKASKEEHWHMFGPQIEGERICYSCPKKGKNGDEIVQITKATMIRIPMNHKINPNGNRFRTYKVISIKAEGSEESSTDENGYIELQDELFPKKKVQVNGLKDNFEVVAGPENRRSYKRLVLPKTLTKKSGPASIDDGSDIQLEFEVKTETKVHVDAETLRDYYDFSITDDQDKMKYTTKSNISKGFKDPSTSYADGVITVKGIIYIPEGTYNLIAKLTPKHQDEDLEDESLRADEVETSFKLTVTYDEEEDDEPDEATTPAVTKTNRSRNTLTVPKASQGASVSNETSSSATSRRKLDLSTHVGSSSQVVSASLDMDEVESNKSLSRNSNEQDQTSQSEAHDEVNAQDNQDIVVPNSNERVTRSKAKQTHIEEENETEDEEESEEDQIEDVDEEKSRKRGRSSTAQDNPTQKARKLHASMNSTRNNRDFGKSLKDLYELYTNSDSQNQTLIRTGFQEDVE